MNMFIYTYMHNSVHLYIHIQIHMEQEPQHLAVELISQPLIGIIDAKLLHMNTYIYTHIYIHGYIYIHIYIYKSIWSRTLSIWRLTLFGSR